MVPKPLHSEVDGIADGQCTAEGLPDEATADVGHAASFEIRAELGEVAIVEIDAPEVVLSALISTSYEALVRPASNPGQAVLGQMERRAGGVADADEKDGRVGPVERSKRRILTEV
jgi:hypothetical protein